jgi:hypothetical protein
VLALQREFESPMWSLYLAVGGPALVQPLQRHTGNCFVVGSDLHNKNMVFLLSSR